MKILMVAGEASGDTHGEALVSGLKEIYPDVDIYGIGGKKMISRGLRPYYTIESLQVHGLVEVFRHLPRLYQILWNLRDSLDVEKPDAVVLIDYPGFNLKLAAYAKKRNIPVILFSSPQVWAWRKKRIFKIAKVVDKIIVLFPFEEKIYREVGVNVSFIGHPLADKMISPEALQTFKKEQRLESDKQIITIAPGSRPSEITRHLPVILEALPLIQRQIDNARFILPIADTLDFQWIEQMVANSPVNIKLIRGNFIESIHIANAAIVASGTATLQTGLSLTPFIIIYRVAALTFWIASRLAQIPYIGIVNVLANRYIVPELLQHDFTPERVAEETCRILKDSNYRDTMKSDLQKIKYQIGEPGAYKRAVKYIHEFLDA